MIRLLLLTNQLERKVLNQNSLLIYPRTPQKQREYRELVVRSFYLANADPKQTAAMVRALVKTRDIFIDEKLNMLVIKDTPEAVQLAERLVASQDLGEPEVMLEVEVMEVQSSRLQELGLKYPGEALLRGAGRRHRYRHRHRNRNRNRHRCGAAFPARRARSTGAVSRSS